MTSLVSNEVAVKAEIPDGRKIIKLFIFISCRLKPLARLTKLPVLFFKLNDELNSNRTAKLNKGYEAV